MLQAKRVVSGMRATGALHLGHYHGVLKNWVEMQYQQDCFFFVADWHALTTHYDDVGQIEAHTWTLIIDWLAAGLNPNHCNIFVQSHVPEHAQLHLLLSMITPLSWLERIPTYKDQQEKLKLKDLATYGFLGYPLLQAADILIYKPHFVPVGEDQVAHLELAREVARRFNHLYGREPNFEEKCQNAVSKLGKKNAQLFDRLKTAYQTEGNKEALETGRALLATQPNLSLLDRERLSGYLEGCGKEIFPEPQALLTPCSKMPGLDGQKMSKSYGNVIGLREEAGSVRKKIQVMPTDPARVRRSDPGEPTKCPVYALHQVYSDQEAKDWVEKGCRSAGIGCLECKQVLSDKIVAEQAPIIERGKEYEANPQMIREIARAGKEAARCIAQETMEEINQAMGLSR